MTVHKLLCLPPIVTAVAPPRFVPVMVTVVPPVDAHEFGLIDVTVGGSPYVKAIGTAAAPTVVYTTTSASPAEPGGVVAVSKVVLETVTLDA
jgi:hypothetical protein